MGGVRKGERNIATAGGIRHEFRVTWRAKQVHEWDRDSLRGHTYIYPDRALFKAWLHKIGRADLPCGEAVQNAAHVMTAH